MQKRILVTGAGGFIGHHLVKKLVSLGHYVRGADIKYPEFERSPADEFRICDLRTQNDTEIVVRDMDEIYNLAANMGGMGFISKNHGEIIRENSLIHLQTVMALLERRERALPYPRVLYTSSACVYPQHLQEADPNVRLRETDAVPANPQDAYGWEKLFSEFVYKYNAADLGFEARIARLHNVYGPLGTWDGGREKAPAAICRKVAEAKLTGSKTVEVWGDGLAVRSYCYIDDCVSALIALMASDYREPLNIGSEEPVTVNQMVEVTSKIAPLDGVRVEHVEGPQGVRNRGCSSDLCREVLGFGPSTSFHDGIKQTYPWIECQVRRKLAGLPTGRG